MERFLLREISSENIKSELITIDYDSHYLDEISDKFKYKNIKIYGLTSAQANILKQTALIFGADCAVNRNVITGKAELSDAILCGSLSQLKKIASKLKVQPFKLAILADDILNFIESKQRKTKLVGILNITPDSFSDGGLYFSPMDAEKHLVQLIEDGADIIDIGAESTRPNATHIEAQEQIERLKPIFNFIKKSEIKIPISIDTRSSVVADFALNSGAKIINDVSGFDYDSEIGKVISKYHAGVIIQHSKENPIYDNVVEEVFVSLKNKIEYAQSLGINDIIIDPGIGFGKSREDSIALLNNIKTFYSLNVPIMVGISRKSVLSAENCSNETKDALTLAYSYPLIRAGVDFLRVHNVKLHKEFLNTIPG